LLAGGLPLLTLLLLMAALGLYPPWVVAVVLLLQLAVLQQLPLPLHVIVRLVLLLLLLLVAALGLYPP
jgi:hypothetical protein